MRRTSPPWGAYHDDFCRGRGPPRRGVDRTIFVGSCQQEDLHRYYGAADVAVSVPWYEPFGITPLEAMACGTPVVGGRVRGIRTTVAHGLTGYLVPPRNPRALAARLRTILTDPDLRDRMGRAARRRVQKSYAWERVESLASGVFSEVLAEHARPPLEVGR